MESLFAAARAAPALEFWLGTSLAIALTVATFYFWFRFLFRARLIEDTPTAKIRSAPQGYLELVGHGEWMEGPPILAPYSGTECVWFEFKVEQKNDKGHWERVNSGKSDALFLLVDDTGECVIDPDGAEVTPSVTDRWYGSSGSLGAAVLSQPGEYRYTEKRLHRGAALYAIGHFRTRGTGHGSDVKDDTAAILRLWKRYPDVHLKKFDANQDGEIDMQEWSTARAAAKQQALAERAERQVSPVTHLMSKRPTPRQPFLLSARPQFNLVERFRIYAIASLMLFVVAGVASSGLLWVRFYA